MIKILNFLLFLSLATTLTVESKIYKYTDVDGNIHYTDKKPSENAEESKIKPLTVVKSMYVEPATTRRRTEHNKKKANGLFENFVISSPKQDTNIWGTGGNVIVSVNLSEKLPGNYRIKFFLDGIPHGKVKTNTQMISDVERGEHTIYAQVVNANSRTIIKTTPKVPFYTKQHSKK